MLRANAILPAQTDWEALAEGATGTGPMPYWSRAIAPAPTDVLDPDVPNGAGALETERAAVPPGTTFDPGVAGGEFAICPIGTPVGMLATPCGRGADSPRVQRIARATFGSRSIRV